MRDRTQKSPFRLSRRQDPGTAEAARGTWRPVERVARPKGGGRSADCSHDPAAMTLRRRPAAFPAGGNPHERAPIRHPLDPVPAPEGEDSASETRPFA
jgi:hypothetical protein